MRTKGAGRGQEKRGLARRASSVPFALACLVLAGCHFSTFPDPNSPKGAGDKQPEVLQRQIKGASDALFARVLTGEITNGQYQDLLAQYADGLLKDLDIENADPSMAWQYGQAFKTGRLWKGAEALFRKAVQVAKDDDRRVNDTLQLANALAHEGKIDEAVAEARKTFDAPPEYKAPILYGVYLEIAPGGAGQGKENDAKLARLIEDAIRQSDLVKVDPKSDAGEAFTTALPHHQHNARRLAAKLYLSAGKEADAERVLGGKLPTIRI